MRTNIASISLIFVVACEASGDDQNAVSADTRETAPLYGPPPPPNQQGSSMRAQSTAPKSPPPLQTIMADKAPDAPAFSFETAPNLSKSPEDIGGIRLGMTVDEVVASLRPHNLTPVTTEYWYNGFSENEYIDLVRDTRLNVKYNWPLEPTKFMTKISTGHLRTEGQHFTIHFARPPEANRTIAIQREQEAKSAADASLEAVFLEALTKKYGKPTDAKVTEDNHIWRAHELRWVRDGIDCDKPLHSSDFSLTIWKLRRDGKGNPDPNLCGVVLKANLHVPTQGTFAGLVTRSKITLDNDGAVFINQQRHAAYAKARHAAWVEKQRTENAAAATAPKL